MIEIAAVSALLGPALPYLLSAADDVATKASEALGGATWEFAKRMWGKLGGRLGERPGAREAAERAASEPDNQIAQIVFTDHLDQVLKADPALAAEIEQLLAEAKDAGAVRIDVRGDRNFVNTGRMTGSSVVFGDGSSAGKG